MSPVKPGGRMAEFARTKRETGLLLPVIKRQMLADMDAPDDHWNEKGMRVIHPSEMAKANWCPRATFLRIKSGLRPVQDFNFNMENIFDEGNTIHDKWQRRMQRTGKLWGAWKCAVCRTYVAGEKAENLPTTGCLHEPYHQHHWDYWEVPLDQEEDYLIAGNADGAIVGDDFLVEIKSIGMGTIRIEAPNLVKKYYKRTVDGKSVYDLDGLWRDLKRPFTSHVRQASVYLWLAKQCGLPFDRIVFVYEFKANQQVKEFVLKLNMDTMQPLLDKAALIQLALASGDDLPCEHGGCDECAAMEERIRGANDPAAREGRDATARPGESEGSGEAGEAEAGRRTVGRTTRRSRAASLTEGSTGQVRARPDGAVPEAERVGPVPGDPARGGTGRRTIRGRRSREAQRVRSDS